MPLASVTDTGAGRVVRQADDVHIQGDWTLLHYAYLKKTIDDVPPIPDAARVDLQALGALDTAGAALLVDLLGSERLQRVAQWAPELSGPRQRSEERRVGKGCGSRWARERGK